MQASGDVAQHRGRGDRSVRGWIEVRPFPEREPQETVVANASCKLEALATYEPPGRIYQEAPHRSSDSSARCVSPPRRPRRTEQTSRRQSIRRQSLAALQDEAEQVPISLNYVSKV